MTSNSPQGPQYGTRDAVSDFAHGSEEMLALYRLAVANASGAVWALDLKSRVVYQSAAIRHQLGYEAHELAGEFSQWTELLHPDDRALMAADGFFDSTKDESIEYRMRHKDGTYRWILGSVWVVRDAEGHSHSLFGTQLDITDRKRAETELAKSEERLSLVAQATGVAISDIDLLTQNVWCNDAFESMFGVAPAHASSADDWWLGHIHPDDRARVATAYAKARASQNPLSEDSYRWRHNDDEDDITLVEMTHLGRDSKGTVVRVLKALVDVTERRRTESKLRYLANELNDSERRTRRDLARDLHDYLAQMLIACLLKIRALPRPSSGLPVLDEIEALIVDAEEYTRTLITKLSPEILYDLGLPSALDWLAVEMKRQFDLSVSVECKGVPPHEMTDAGVFAFEVIRELVVNVAKHAQTAEASVVVRFDADTLNFVVEDHGVGFDPAAIGDKRLDRHFGLFSIRQRLGAENCTMEIDTSIGRGTRVSGTLPVRKENA